MSFCYTCAAKSTNMTDIIINEDILDTTTTWSLIYYYYLHIILYGMIKLYNYYYLSTLDNLFVYYIIVFTFFVYAHIRTLRDLWFCIVSFFVLGFYVYIKTGVMIFFCLLFEFLAPITLTQVERLSKTVWYSINVIYLSYYI